jgi:hypothetical protein
MRVKLVLAVAAVSLIAAGCHRHKGNPFPPAPAPDYAGSYAKSCRSITTLGSGFISAECADEHGKFITTYLLAAACHGDIGNINGVMACNGATASKTKPEAMMANAASSAAVDASAAAPAPAVKAADGLKP